MSLVAPISSVVVQDQCPGTESIQVELEKVCAVLERQVEEMVAWTQEVTSTRHAQKTGTRVGHVTKLRLLEIYCHPKSELTKSVQQAGFPAERFTLDDGDLGTPEGRQKLWDIIVQRQPTEVWMAPECGAWGNFSRRNMGRSLTLKQKVEAKRSEQRQHLQLCAEVFRYQMEQGQHFHLEQPVGSEALEQPELCEVKEGTLRTCFDMCVVGNLKSPEGQPMKKRTVVHTTSRRLHELLDARYCPNEHQHQPIVGSYKGPDGWKSLSKWAEKYTSQFARQISKYLRSKGRSVEWPVCWDELLADQSSPTSQHVALVGEVLKRRRLVGKQVAVSVGTEDAERDSERRCSGPRSDRDESELRELFVRVDGQTPRVGVRLLDPGTPLFREIQALCPAFQVKQIEVCRGTDRFRVPRTGTDVTHLGLRQVWILHRNTGEVRCQGPPERWQRLVKRQQVRKTEPARISVTVFGTTLIDAEPATPAVRRRASNSVEEESEVKRPRTAASLPAVVSPETPIGDEPPVAGHPPKAVARHGPAYLGLGKDDQAWIKRVHHRMGHPDVEKMTRFLKHTHADPRIIAGAREYQCDACVESNRGFQSARPSAIHENLGFNALVGMDMVSWTNLKGTAYEFLHVIDEGTLFHMARPSHADAVSQCALFEDMWMSWAGPPRELYVDPGSSFVSEYWVRAMQEHDIRMHVTATDSH